MRKVISFIIISFLLTSSGYVHASRKLEHPPIPTDNPNTEKVAIVMTKEKQTQKQIQALRKQYPNMKIRHVFQHAINGFSIKAPIHVLNKLSQNQLVTNVSSVNNYKVHSDSNVEIIGGELVRGIFDGKNHRLTGKGVKVGVIDTGIDYSHPDLAKNYGGGQDFVDGDHDPMETKSMGEKNTLHGTHVAGIIAANGRLKGVAPEATIIAYRALGPGGSGTTEQVITAIEEAIKDKVDVLNLSLGNEVNGPDLPISLALNNAVANGVIAVTSSGNSGPNVWTVGSPGTAGKAISVGASTPPMQIPYLKVDGMEDIRLNPLQGSKIWDLDNSYKIVEGGIGSKNSLSSVKGKIVLIKRGEITFTEKVENAYEAGAKGVIIYNNTNGVLIGNLLRIVPIPVVGISKKQGEILLKKIRERHTVGRTRMKEEKDLLAEFSSRGPVTSTWEIKPDVVAPGVAINSTVPGGYLYLHGTSMAAPHVAGACALIKQAHPEWGPEQVKAALMNTAVIMKNSANHPYKAYEQGAGRIQIEEAIQTNILVIPGSLQFGKFKLTDRLHDHKSFITIENVGDKTETISFHVPKKEMGINWHMPLSFRLGPKEKRKVAIEMSVDPTLFKKKLFDGTLKINVGEKMINIPYLYVLEEPEYPRVMGFEFGSGDKKNKYRYEVYLPGGADEFGIALFDIDTYQFIQFLDWKRNVGKGQLQQEIDLEKFPEKGIYLAKIFAKKSGKEDMLETIIIF